MPRITDHDVALLSSSLVLQLGSMTDDSQSLEEFAGNLMRIFTVQSQLHAERRREPPNNNSQTRTILPRVVPEKGAARAA